jgi:hypothetical protein
VTDCEEDTMLLAGGWLRYFLLELLLFVAFGRTVKELKLLIFVALGLSV